MNKDALLSTDLPGLKLFKKGKVRDVYDLDDKLLIVATDRISCFDVVLSCGIPYKGKILTQLSCFWFDLVKDIIPNHLLSGDVEKFPAQLSKYRDLLRHRSMLVKKSRLIPVECVVRGYLSGSGWKEYRESRSICGVSLPAGLKECAKLPEPIFTPSSKEEVGHDINVTFENIQKQIGKDTAGKIKDASIAIYKKARDYADKKGIIIADTKFEFGVHNDQIILIDEILTPDSSRFWPKEAYEPGRGQSSFDKQFVRDYLETLDWDKTPPAPKLPDEIIEKTSLKYFDALAKLAPQGIKIEEEIKKDE
ncbi:MAG: phosphoribosylaminoimidazolesuccinocarboxamide synthase [Candidatus Omnitrophica bacterium]|nr:phosphoribosylaminoimidazolesuccinocarboxamide synthase [Candidatus Omnitrophota bacterium]